MTVLDIFLKVWKWLFGALLVVAAGAALILHKTTGSDKLGDAAVNAIEAAHQPHIDALNQKLDELGKDEASNQSAIAKAQADVDSRRQDLLMVYKNTGMTDDEIVSRLSKMKV
jgi:hypothetical protein